MQHGNNTPNHTNKTITSGRRAAPAAVPPLPPTPLVAATVITHVTRTGAVVRSPRGGGPSNPASLSSARTRFAVNPSASQGKQQQQQALSLSPHAGDEGQRGGQLHAAAIGDGVVTTTTTSSPDHHVTVGAAAAGVTSSGRSNGPLTVAQLRSIGNLVDHNRALPHRQRSTAVAAVIPTTTANGSTAALISPRSTARGLAAASHGAMVDSVTGLAIAPVDPQESALDVPVRLHAPADFHAPTLVDPRTREGLPGRLVTLLRGATAVPVHWGGNATSGGAGSTTTTGLATTNSASSRGFGGGEGSEQKDHAHVRALNDAKVRCEAARRAGNAAAEARCRCLIASMHYNARNLDAAIRQLTAAVPLLEGTANVPGLSFAHCTIGAAAYYTGEYKLALLHFRKLEALGGSLTTAVARINMGVCYMALHEHAFATQALNDAADAAAEAAHPVAEAVAAGDLGLACMRHGLLLEAQTALERCLEHCSVAGDRVGAAIVLLLLGQVFVAAADQEHAAFYLDNALRVAADCGCTDVVNIAKVTLGICQGRAAAQERAVTVAAAMGHRPTVQDVLSTLR